MKTSLKSIFVSLYLLFLVAATIMAVLHITRDVLSLGWLGVALTTSPFLIFLSYLMLTQRRARTSPRLPSIIAFAVVGVAMSMWSWAIGISGSLPAIVASVGLAAFLIYVFWYSDLGPRHSAVFAIGKPLPLFSLERVDGSAFQSSAWTGRPSVLIFFRGNWCPLCMAQIKEVANLYREIEALGARVALISPQTDTHTKQLAQRWEVAFEYYVDRRAAAARQLGIDHPGGLPLGMQALGYASDTVLPTVVITDTAGIVRFVDETDNYRVRPEPQLFLNVLRAQAA